MLKCKNPATGDVIEELRCDDRRSVHATFEKLQTGQTGWARREQGERTQAVAEFGDLFDERRQSFVDLLAREVGTPIRQAQVEVDRALSQIESFVEFIDEADSDKVINLGQAGRETVEREPLGVVASISTWNFACLLGCRELVPALLAGNAVVYKPSEHAALLGEMLVETMWEAGIPRDVVDVAIGDGCVGDYILDEEVDAVFFTGRYGTGRMIAEKLATRMIPRQLSLGGKGGVYVCEDVDIEETAARVADGAFYNSGQSCRAAERLYVHEAIDRRFTNALCRRIDSYAVGDPARRSTYIGPVASRRHVNELEYQIGDAVQKGARLLLGGRAQGGRGNFFEPTVLVDADHRMLVMREETMGPVIAVQRVCDDDEAVHRLADSDYGLSAGVFSRNRERARRLLEQLDVGSVYWNGCHDAEPGLVGCGRGDSGMSMVDSQRGVDRFTRPKSWYLAAR